MPEEYVLKKYEKYYDIVVSRRIYHDVAKIAFEYSCVLCKAGYNDEAINKFKEGVQALASYGFRGDRTLSEILDCCVPFQKKYGLLGIDWFYELYHLSMTVVKHTDGKSTSSLSERKANSPQKEHDRAESDSDFGQIDVNVHASSSKLLFISGNRNAKTVPGQGTGYACA